MNNKNSEIADRLFLACQDGKLADFDHLIAEGADPNVVDVFSFRRPIHVAVRNGQTDIVRRLADNPDVNLDVIDGGCWTPKSLAEHLSYREIADIISSKLPLPDHCEDNPSHPETDTNHTRPAAASQGPNR